MCIQQSGNKLIALIGILILIVILTSCGAGWQDWEYDHLPNDYEIWRINSEDIVLMKNKGSTERVINRYILEFCYNDSYIGIKKIMVDENIPYHEVYIEELDATNPSYFLVDTVNDTVMGPYTSEEYTIKIKDLEIESMCDWIKTVPKPQGAK